MHAGLARDTEVLVKDLSAALLTLSFLILLSSAAPADQSVRIVQPSIVSKAEWGSMKIGETYGDQPYNPYSQGPMDYALAITIHHTTIPLGTNPPNIEEDKQKVLSIQRFHVSKGWGDAGYHFLIGSEGSIYEGRPLGYTSTHAPPNTRNLGVSVIGDFQTKEYPNAQQLDAVIRLVTWMCDKYDIDPTAKITIYNQSNLAVCGHRDWGATDCPGDRLYALLPSIRERVRAGLLTNAPAYGSRLSMIQYLPHTLLAGHEYQLPLAVRNTGYVLWSPLNQVRLESLAPDALSIAEPALNEKEDVQPLSNRRWQVALCAPQPGTKRLGVATTFADTRFGQDVAWDVQSVAADAFVSQWLVLGPIPAQSPDAAFMTDCFQGTPLDVLDVMDEASEKAHGYAVTDQYRTAERGYRGSAAADQRAQDSGRYYKGEETFRISVKGAKGDEVILRRRIDSDVRDQTSVVYIDGKRLSAWKFADATPRRGLRDLDLIIPSRWIAGKDSITVRVKSTGSAEYGNSSFRYELLDSAEPLVAPKKDDQLGELKWKPWKSDAGICDLSTMIPDASAAADGALYMAAYVKSPITKYIEVRTGYNGSVKAWLNGQRAISGRASAQGFPDTLAGEALLKRGWNRLLVKVSLEPGMNELYVRLCDREGRPIPGLKVSLEPLDPSKPELIAAL